MCEQRSQNLVPATLPASMRIPLQCLLPLQLDLVEITVDTRNGYLFYQIIVVDLDIQVNRNVWKLLKNFFKSGHSFVFVMLTDSGAHETDF